MNESVHDTQTALPELSVLYRVRRRLKAQGKKLSRSAVGSRQFAELGRYFIVDVATGSVLEMNVDLEALARKLGAIRPADSVVFSES